MRGIERVRARSARGPRALAHLAALTGMLVLGLGLCAPAAAHGDAAHRRTGPVVKEQKPWGTAGDARQVRRTLEVTMGDDMRFRPDRLDVRLGETVRIVVRNRGAMLHEFVLGTREELEAHAALMLKFPDMEHDEPWMAHVSAGRRGELIWTFNRPGEFEFACLIAGHFQAGMVGRVRVVAPPASR